MDQWYDWEMDLMWISDGSIVGSVVGARGLCVSFFRELGFASLRVRSSTRC